MNKTITNLSFRQGKAGSPDNELIALSNEFVHLPGNEGIPATSLLRNFIIRKLREALEAAKAQPRVAG